MDDNELDRLFGEDSGADDKAPDDAAKTPEKSGKKKADRKKPSDNAVKESMFVERQADNSQKEAEDQDEPEEDKKSESDSGSDKSREDKDKSDGKVKDSGKKEENEDKEEEDGEESETSEDDKPEDKEKKDGKETHEERAKAHEERPSRPPVNKAKISRRPEPEPQVSLRDMIPLNTKSLVIIGLAVVAVVMVSLVMFLPAFRVRQTHIEGNVVLTEQEILQEVGLEYDAHLMSGVSGNIFDIIRLDYGKTEARIKKENPYIEDIRITIKLPSTVEIKIKERSKVCYVRTPDGYAALDRDGIVLELSSFDSNKTVQPVICGLNITSAELGKHIKISNMNDYKKSIIILGAMLAADNASVGGDYSMFENTSEVRILPSGYIFLTIYSPSGNLIQIKLDSLDSISDDMAWLLYLFNSDRLDKVSVDGVLDMTDDDPIFREY